MGMIIQNGKLFSGEPKTTYKERVLWSGNQTVTTSGVDITLNDNLSEYDEVIFEYHDSSFNAISNFLVNGLTIGDSYIQEAYRPNSLGVWFTYTNDTTLNVKAISSNITHTKITGIKYGDTVKRKDYHVYSTEEKVVGEWIDGSTLYEKTIYKSSITLAMSSVTAVENLTSLNIDTFVGSNTAKFVVDGNRTITDGLMGIHYNSTTKELNVQQRYSDRNITGELSITIRYTKTSS